jgi:hypothetical protein
MTILNTKAPVNASPITRQKLINDIEEYCSRHNISTSEFGRQVFKDSSFYGRVIRGRSPTLERIEMVYNFIAANGETSSRSNIHDLID